MANIYSQEKRRKKNETRDEITNKIKSIRKIEKHHREIDMIHGNYRRQEVCSIRFATGVAQVHKIIHLYAFREQKHYIQ